MFESTLSKVDEEKAVFELNECPISRDQKLNALWDLCQSSESITPETKAKLNFYFLIRFLRVEKFDIKCALRRLERYFELQRDWPELYQDFNIDSVRYIYERGIIELISQPDDEGTTIIIFRNARWNPEWCIHEAYRAIAFLFEYLLQRYSFWIIETIAVIWKQNI